MTQTAAIGPVTGPTVTTLAVERSIGRILLDLGKLRAEDAERVLRLQKESGLRFGEAALKLGLVRQADIDQALASQFHYPYLRADQGAGLARELVAAYHPFSPEVEALRALRTQLLLRWFTSERRTLAVVGTAAGEGRSYTCANLAIVFSQLGENTLLVDADMRQPRQHLLFNLDNRSGLSSVLSARADLDAIERIPHLANLSVLPAGPTPPNPLDLLGRPQFRALLAQLVQRFDVILFDTPAACAGGDALTVAARTGGALMMTRAHHSRIRRMQAFADELAHCGSELVGTILNRY